MSTPETPQVQRYGFEIARDEQIRQAAVQAEREQAEAAEAQRQRQQQAQQQEVEFRRELKQVARLIAELPFIALFRLMFKAILAFWVANLVIALILWALVAATLGPIVLPR